MDHGGGGGQELPCEGPLAVGLSPSGTFGADGGAFRTTLALASLPRTFPSDERTSDKTA